MGYVDKYLLDGEHVVYRSGLHWIVYILPILLFIASVAICVLSLSLVAPWLMYIGYALMIVSFLWFCYKWINARGCEFAVTNRRVIMKTGLFNRQITELQLAKAEALHYEFGFWGGVFGFGTVTVSTGDEKNVYRMMANPEKFRFEINKQIDTYYSPAAHQQAAKNAEGASQQQ